MGLSTSSLHISSASLGVRPPTLNSGIEMDAATANWSNSSSSTLMPKPFNSSSSDDVYPCFSPKSLPSNTRPVSSRISSMKFSSPSVVIGFDMAQSACDRMATPMMHKLSAPVNSTQSSSPSSPSISSRSSPS